MDSHPELDVLVGTLGVMKLSLIWAAAFKRWNDFARKHDVIFDRVPFLFLFFFFF